MSNPSPQFFEKAMRGGGDEARLRGRWGEQIVAARLRDRGWSILALNYRCRMGEIDIIAADRRYLIFVEVKMRRDNRFGQAKEAVTGEKQRKLRAAAQWYLLQNPTRLQPRFDVAEVYAPYGTETPQPVISYIENAF